MGKSTEQARRLKNLFVEASGLEGDERHALLDRVTSESTELGHALRKLLAAERQVQDDDFLEKPAADLQVVVRRVEPDPNVGRAIGPYELLDGLGAGGMGHVYLAARRDDYEQLVAIKLVKRGMDTDELIRRFEFERQTLAALEHPGIARLLDGGTDAGLPYFVMEYVRGRPIDQACDRDRLTIADRVRLFRSVCLAVGYAHDRTIVHRDLKPANILVTADGAPKLLDFGLARLVTPVAGLGAFDLTRPEDRFMTASYASPEQLQGDTVGKPSDVYSLGVVLYELLTGRRPFRLEGFSRRQIERIVSYETPAAPSAVVREPFEQRRPDGTERRETSRSLGHARSTAPDALAQEIGRDLDNIVQMALQKEPRDRYADANALAEDLRRWLDDEPVVARPVSFWYATGKFVKRNRLLVGATTALIVVLAAGLVTSLALMTYAFRQRDLARESARAETAAEAEIFRQERRELSEAISRRVVLGNIEDPQLRILLAMEGVRISPTPQADFALRWALAGPGVPLTGHTDDIRTTFFSPDGKRVVSGSQDGTARIWSLSTDEVVELIGHEGAVESAKFNDDGPRVVTASDDGTARVWNAATGACDLVLGDGSVPLFDASFSPDGRWIVTAGRDGTILMWDAKTGAPGTVLHDPDDQTPTAIISHNGRRLLRVSFDRTGSITDLTNPDVIAEIKGHRGPVNAVAFDPPAERLVTASDDQTARVWDATTGQQLLIMHGHRGPVTDAQFSPDGRWIVTVGRDDTVRVWDARTGELLGTEGGHAAAFSPDGAWLVVARADDSAVILPWEAFAPLEHNLRVAGERVTRELTPAERARYLGPSTDEETTQLMRAIPTIPAE